MRNLLLGSAMTAVTILGSMVDPTPVRAGANLAFCLASGGGNTECYYATYDQCQATASGTGAECIANPDTQARRDSVPARPVRRPLRRR